MAFDEKEWCKKPAQSTTPAQLLKRLREIPDGIWLQAKPANKRPMTGKP